MIPFFLTTLLGASHSNQALENNHVLVVFFILSPLRSLALVGVIVRAASSERVKMRATSDDNVDEKEAVSDLAAFSL